MAPAIDHDMRAYLLRTRVNNSIITVTCAHCGSKFQKEFSIDMFSSTPTPEPLVAAVAPVTEPEIAPGEKISKLKYWIVRILIAFVILPFLFASFIMIVVTFQTLNIRAFLVALVVTGVTVYLMIATNNYEQRLRKRLKHQRS